MTYLRRLLARLHFSARLPRWRAGLLGAALGGAIQLGVLLYGLALALQTTGQFRFETVVSVALLLLWSGAPTTFPVLLVIQLLSVRLEPVGNLLAFLLIPLTAVFQWGALRWLVGAGHERMGSPGCQARRAT